MNKYYIVISAVIVLLLVAGVAISSLTASKTESNSSDSLQWSTDLDQALAEAKSTNKTVFVDFYADWCSYCKQMDSGTYTSTQVMEKLNQSYVLVKVNVDENPDLSTKYQAYSLPTMVIMDSSGNEIKRITGYQTQDQLLSQI
jgi:thioredoxin 1